MGDVMLRQLCVRVFVGIALIATLLVAARGPAGAQSDNQFGELIACVQANGAEKIKRCSALINDQSKDKSVRAGAYLQRGDLYRDRRELDRAIADYTAALALKPESGMFRARAGIWLQKGDLDHAISDLTEAIQLDLASDAWVIQKYGKDHAARQMYSAALLMDHVDRGKAYEKKGNRDQAIGDFKAASEIQLPKNTTPEYELLQITARQRLAALAPASPVAVTAAPAAIGQIATSPSPASPSALPPGRRVALVIGNSAYKAVPALANPRRDAETVAAALRGTGFQSVTLVNDLTREQLTDALRAFAAEAERADWALVYFAGHGIEIGGLNYLIPVDARLAADRDVQFEAVSLDQVMGSVEGARKLRLVLLDACRDNPFAPQMRRTVATRSIGRGLAQVEPDSGTLVVYSAKHGQVALDGEGANSPFVAAFVKRLASPGIEIRKLFDLVRDDVMATTERRQQPFSYGSVPGSEDFFFTATR
jgi:tetratricopeptide (TPR) repeat protein